MTVEGPTPELTETERIELMIRAGMKYLQENPAARPEFDLYDRGRAICMAANQDAQAFMKAISGFRYQDPGERLAPRFFVVVMCCWLLSQGPAAKDARRLGVKLNVPRLNGVPHGR